MRYCVAIFHEPGNELLWIKKEFPIEVLPYLTGRRVYDHFKKEMGVMPDFVLCSDTPIDYIPWEAA